ncbi:transcriptional regulator [Bifidobacterium xylocopae]|uniref:Transcriptional regulator n=1 Tax=Bifidobacterium xylocopae TaxID=2493119 RepID=A0A366KAR8_9BIFI|nr:transcriptional regulator [Bifidobacterium xylocopae]
MSNMKRWLHEEGISYSKLASTLHQTASNISNKVNGITQWQQQDLLQLNKIYGLSADFVIGLPNSKENLEVFTR